MTHSCAAFIAAFFLFAQTVVASAQEVTLTARDGAVVLQGDLLGFDGDYYRVQTRWGELTVDGARVDCTGAGCPDLASHVPDITFSGARALGSVLVPALIEAFARRGNYILRRDGADASRVSYVLADRTTGQDIGRFHIRASSTEEGLADLMANEGDIAMSLRAYRPEEVDAARQAGLGDMNDPSRARVVALDGIVAVVAPGRTIRALSLRDLAAVLAGKLTNWKDLGGPDAPIALHLPVAGNGLGQALEDQLLAPMDLARTTEAVFHERLEDLTRAVQSDPLALGITSLSRLGNAEPVALGGRCGLLQRASVRGIRTGDYPLGAPVFLHLPMRRLPSLGRAFLDFTESPGAQLVIQRAGYVDLQPEEIAVDAQGDRLASAILAATPGPGLAEVKRMVRRMRQTSRLTTTLRVEADGDRLTAQSAAQFDHLVRALRNGLLDGRRLTLVEFGAPRVSEADAEAEAAAGGESLAVRLSARLDNALRDAANDGSAAGVLLATESFDAPMPLACADSALGDAVNRRVELWVE